MKIKVCRTRRDIAEFLIATWLKLGRRAIRARGWFFVALPGGKTPVGIFRAIGRSRKIDIWDRTHIFLTDEHLVPYDDEANNYRMIEDTLLRRVDIPSHNVHPIDVETSPSASARAYEDELRRTFGLAGGRMPVFDLMILGIGENGHTASLLPGSPALAEKKRLAVAAYDRTTAQHRVTLTFPVINHAARVMFLVTGRHKAEIIRRIIEEKDGVPASLVNPGAGRLLYILDRQASRLL